MEQPSNGKNYEKNDLDVFEVGEDHKWKGLNVQKVIKGMQNVVEVLKRHCTYNAVRKSKALITQKAIK